MSDAVKWICSMILAIIISMVLIVFKPDFSCWTSGIINAPMFYYMGKITSSQEKEAMLSD
jgi:hypothetical protein